MNIYSIFKLDIESVSTGWVHARRRGVRDGPDKCACGAWKGGSSGFFLQVFSVAVPSFSENAEGRPPPH